jgi:hypothetical protein
MPAEKLPMIDNLPINKHKFACSFLMDLNVKFAAKRCGIKVTKARAWLKDPDVVNFISEKGKEYEQKCDVTIEQCLNELKKPAFFTWDEIADDFKVELEAGKVGITLKDFNDMDTSAIQSLNCKINAQGVPYVEVKPYDKLEALKLLIDNLKGYQGPKSVHIHLDSEKVKNMTSQEISANYQLIVNGEE